MMSDPKAAKSDDQVGEANSPELTAHSTDQPTSLPPPLPMAAKPAKSSGLPRPYVALWGAAAVVSMGYLAVAITAPGLIGMEAAEKNDQAIMAENTSTNSGGSSTHARPSDRELEENLTRARMEIAKLRTELTSRDQDSAKPAKPFAIENVKTSVATVQPTAPQETAPKITEETGSVIPPAPTDNGSDVVTPTLINQKPVETSTIASSASAEPKATDTPAPAAASVAAAAENAAEEKSIAKATLLNGTPDPKPSAIETGSIRIPPPPVRGPARPQKLVQPVALQSPSVVKSALPDLTQARNAAAQAGAAAAKPVAAFAAPVIERAPQPPATSAGLGLRLARGASLEAIRLTWSLMNERHGAVLAGLEPRYVLVPGPNPSQPLYQLIAGPLIGAGEALQKCQDVSARGLPCEIGEYAGNAL